MKGYDITKLDEVLTIRRRKLPLVLPLLFFTFIWCLMLTVPFANIFIYHYFVWGSVWLAFLVTLISSPMLIGLSRRLGKRVIILDKHNNQILVNGRRMCALTDVRGVKFGSYIVPTDKNRAFSIRGLYLETVQGNAIEIERAVNFGLNYKEVALSIAEFAHVTSNLSRE